ncbi:FAD/NAD(P)-binding domain-containing protein [Tothia fuscella]|uniref:FAD/NAD(P)-binding domain-containing protein n=1 Tax=Tothia fuscella TaxID=1048955 RepID=A0A9P4P142_9PEZI|nr:FAD/NAD(P)-binding domain-containing protein [Tothia fuscella]
MENYPIPTYPTGSLNFLHRLHAQDKSDLPGQAKIPLKIIVSGAGLGGLATAIALARRGHKVIVYEQVEKLGEVGAGIQTPSNSSRLLIRWGVDRYLKDKAVEPVDISFRRWQTGETIGYTKLVPDFRETYGAPYCVVHRAHFHDALFQRAIELGVRIVTGAKVVSYDFDAPSITVEDGTVHAADLVIAADGIRSPARKQLLGEMDRPPTLAGFAAYRATVSAERMKADPDTAWLVEKPSQNCWIGDMRHVMSYSIAGGGSFNMVLSHPESSDPSTWKQETALADMKSHFEGWDPRLVKTINMIDRTLKWPLLSGQPFVKWVADSGKFTILGDAAHAMLPYMSEGAAMAVEDGAALAAVLSKITCKDEIPTALKVFEKERIQRTSQMQQASAINGKLWHFADGPEQEARDASMRPECEGRSFSESPNQWSDPLTANWCYGYDAEREIERAWEALSIS